MALNIGDNFNYQGRKPNFERDSFDTLEEMKSYPETSIDDGHVSFCKETSTWYSFNSNNDISEITGKWKPLFGEFISSKVVKTILVLSQEEYDSIEVKDPNTIYVII